MGAKQYYWSSDKLAGGIDLYPYQVAFGFSIRYAGDFAPAFRIYIGWIKIWGTLK